MAVDILFTSSVVFLMGTLFFWFWEGLGRSLQLWRRVLVWLSLFALNGAIITFVRFLWVLRHLQSLDLDFVQQLHETLPLIRVGFWLATVAFVSCWFATFKTTICGAISSGTILISYVAAAMGV